MYLKTAVCFAALLHTLLYVPGCDMQAHNLRHFRARYRTYVTLSSIFTPLSTDSFFENHGGYNKNVRRRQYVTSKSFYIHWSTYSCLISNYCCFLSHQPPEYIHMCAVVCMYSMHQRMGACGALVVSKRGREDGLGVVRLLGRSVAAQHSSEDHRKAKHADVQPYPTPKG